MKFSTSLKFKFLYLFITVSAIYLSVTGADCEALLGGLTGDLNSGSWQLVRMTGNSQDVCIGEVATFNTNGVASLRCPNSTTRSRNYTYNNNILIFTETGVQYSVSFTSTNSIQQMVLTGTSVDRTLTYNNINTDRNPTGNETGSNSSEIK